MAQKKKNHQARPAANKSAKPAAKPSETRAEALADRKEDFEAKVERAVAAEKAEKAAAVDRKDAVLDKKKEKNSIVSDRQAKEREAKKRAKIRSLEARRKAKAEKIAAKHEARSAKLEEKRKSRAAAIESKKKRLAAKKKKVGAGDEERIRVREAKLAEMQKIRAAKLESKKRKKELRLENHRRRHAQKARFKNASAAERKRILADRHSEQARARKAKLEDKRLKKLEKQRMREDLRKERLEAKRMRHKERDPNGGNHAIFKSRRHVAMFVAVCSVFTVFTGLLTASTVFYRRERESVAQQLNNMYERAFYDLMDDMNNISVKLSKLMISSGDDAERYLVEVIRQSDAAATNLATIPVSESAILNAMKYVNQLGDFCGYLDKKLQKGGSLSESDIENIEKLYDTNVSLFEQMSMFSVKVAGGYRFSDHMDGGMAGNDLNDSFNEIQNGSIEYPKLIYDGPFSESVINAEMNGLTGEEVSRETAEAKVNEYLKDMDVRSVKFESEVDGKLAAYDFSVETSAGNAFVQISKKGGHLMLLSNSRTLDNFDLSVEQCIEKAEQFVASLGYKDMKSVWSSDYSGNVYVNLVSIVGGVEIYPDMLKVKIARDNGDVLGFDSMTYYMNHTEREIGKPALSSMKVRQNVSAKLEIESEKLVLVPVDGGKEVLCYQFYGTYRDMLYFVYSDANTGKEVNVFRVIDSESGALVI